MGLRRLGGDTLMGMGKGQDLKAIPQRAWLLPVPLRWPAGDTREDDAREVVARKPALDELERKRPEGKGVVCRPRKSKGLEEEQGK